MSLPRHARVREDASTGARVAGGSAQAGRKTLVLLAAALAVTGVQTIGASASPATAATGTTGTTGGTARAASTAGSAAVGTASYPVPAGAVFVSPAGADAGTGAAAAPVRTLTRALALTPAGGTIVMRGGVYHESLTVTKTVTIQNYPGETVWLDGAEEGTGGEAPRPGGGQARR